MLFTHYNCMHVLKHWSVSVACFRESLGGGSSLICWTSGIARPRPGSGSWSWSWGQGWLVDQTPGEKAVWEEHAKVSSIFIPAPPAGVLGGGREGGNFEALCPHVRDLSSWYPLNYLTIGEPSLCGGSVKYCERVLLLTFTVKVTVKIQLCKKWLFTP